MIRTLLDARSLVATASAARHRGPVCPARGASSARSLVWNRQASRSRRCTGHPVHECENQGFPMAPAGSAAAGRPMVCPPPAKRQAGERQHKIRKFSRGQNSGSSYISVYTHQPRKPENQSRSNSLSTAEALTCASHFNKPTEPLRFNARPFEARCRAIKSSSFSTLNRAPLMLEKLSRHTD